MTELRFIPIFEDKEFVEACAEYQKIWEENGEKILTAFTEVTGLKLHEERIAVLVY